MPDPAQATGLPPGQGVGAQVACCRAVAGLFGPAQPTAVRVHGLDAADYLHRRLSQSVSQLQAGQVVHACLLNGDGRMISDLCLLAVAPGDYLMLAEPAVRATLAAQLERYVIREQLAVEDVSESAQTVLLAGPRSAAILAAVTGIVPDCMQEGSVASATVNGVEVRLACIRTLGMPGTVVLCDPLDSASIHAALRHAVEQAGGAVCGDDSRKALRVEAGEPQFSVDMDATTIPLEAGLEHTIDFDKGCFPGQEVVARIRNLGHPARVLAGLAFAPPDMPAEGAAVFVGDKNIGRVTSAAYSPVLGRPIALAYVKWDLREPGTRVEVETPSGRIRADVAALPFVN
jgi:folate-binding protein YgfZ